MDLPTKGDVVVFYTVLVEANLGPPSSVDFGELFRMTVLEPEIDKFLRESVQEGHFALQEVRVVWNPEETE